MIKLYYITNSAVYSLGATFYDQSLFVNVEVFQDCSYVIEWVSPFPVSNLQVFFREASVKQVDVPTLTGAFGILPAHVPTLQVLRPGVVTVFNDDGSSVKYFGKFVLNKI